MPIDAPTFPGEREIPLGTVAVLTSVGCVGSALAVDDAPTTAAIFDTPGALGALGSGLVGTYYRQNTPGVYTGPIAGQQIDGPVNIVFTGGSGPAPLPHTGGVAARWTGYIVPPATGAWTFYIDDDNLAQLRVNGVLVIDANNVGSFTSAPIPLTGGTAYPVDLAFWDDNIGPGQITFSWSGPGVPSKTVVPKSAMQAHALTPAATRYLQADWSASEGDRFVSRVRIAVSGDTASPGVALLSSLGYIEFGPPAPEIPLAYIPYTQDGRTYELTLDPPVLARGLIFLPDYLSQPPGGGPYPVVDLLQLQAYEPFEQGESTMALPVNKRSRVGVQAVTLYPYGGPYDATTNCILLGLKSLEIPLKVKEAVVTGGETVFDIDSFETHREAVIKVAYCVSDVRVMNLLLGGRFVLDAANGNGGEVQYIGPNFADRAPYVRLTATSSNGNGKDTFVWPKLKISSGFNYKLEEDKVTIWDLDLRMLWDTTYVAEDGSTGGIMDILYGATGDTAPHS